MQWFGVSVAVTSCAVGLLAGALLLQPRRVLPMSLPLPGAALVAWTNSTPISTADTAYANHQVKALETLGQINPRLYLRQALLDDLRLKGRDVLVLGAGGFTLSQQELLNRCTYVDIEKFGVDIRCMRRPPPQGPQRSWAEPAIASHWATLRYCGWS